MKSNLTNHLYLVLLSLFSFLGIQSQNIIWEHLNIDTALGKATTIDSQNNVISVAAGPMNTSSAGVFVKKYNSDGTLIWSTYIEAIQDPNSGVLEQARPLAVIVDSNDNIIVTGFRFHTDSTTCPFPPCIVTISNKIWKLDSNGNVVFNKTFDGHGRGAYVDIDVNDNIYVNGIGLITDTANDTEFGTILIKLDSSGNTIFTDAYDVVGTGNSINPGVMGFGENFVVVANVSTFNNSLTAWDFSGNILWSMNLNASIDAFKDIVVDKMTNDTYILSEAFPPNPLLTKVDALGNTQYHNSYNLGENTVPFGLKFVDSDKLVFAGTSWSDLGSDSTLYTTIINSNDGSEFMNTTHTLSQNLSRVRALDSDASNGTYVVGVNSTTNGGAPASGSLHAYNFLNAMEWHSTYAASNDIRSVVIDNNQDIYLMTDNEWNLAKYAGNLVLNINDFEANKTMISPNPVRDYINIITDSNTVKTATIYNIMGVEVKKLVTSKLNNIDVSDLMSGTYILIMTSDNNSQKQIKFIKN